MSTVPLRTCIGCYKTAIKTEFIRIVMSSDNSIFVDLDGKKNGRGTYVCPDKDCIIKAMKPDKLNRAFRIAPNSINQIATNTIEKTMQNLFELIKH